MCLSEGQFEIGALGERHSGQLKERLNSLSYTIRKLNSIFTSLNPKQCFSFKNVLLENL